MKIHVCVCCRGEVSAESFGRIIAAMTNGSDYWKFRFGKDATFFFQVVARVHVVDARTKLLQDAVKAGADYLLWIDDDMAPPDDMLERLMKRLDEDPSLDYIGGLAYTKGPPYKPCAFVKPEKEDDPIWVTRLPERVQQVGVTGFACLLGRMAAFKAVDEKTNGQPFVYQKDCGEDAYFFHIAHLLNQKVAVDTSLVVGHVGVTVFDHKTSEAYAKIDPSVLAKYAPVPQG